MAHNPMDQQPQPPNQQRASSPAIGGRRKVVPSKPPTQPQPPVASNPVPQSQPVSVSLYSAAPRLLSSAYPTTRSFSLKETIWLVRTQVPPHGHVLRF